MKKLGIVSLMIVAMVAFCASDASAYRYYGGEYTYLYNAPATDLGGWGDLTGVGPYPYDGTSALSDAASDAGLPRNGDGTANVVYTEPTNGDNNAIGENLGKSAWWWNNAGSNDRKEWLLMDLGQVVEIDAVVSVHNFTRASHVGMDWFILYGSLDGSTWVEMINDGSNPGPPGDMKGQLFHRPIPMTAGRDPGLFRNPATAVYDLDTVSFRYLRFNLSASDSGGFAIAEVLIDAVPEPATMLMLLGGGLFGLLRRRS